MRWDRIIEVAGQRVVEEEWFLQNVNNYTIEQFAKILGRTKDSIAGKAKRPGFYAHDFKQEGIVIEPLEALVVDELKKGVKTVRQLSERLDKSESTVLDLLAALRARGYEILLEDELASIPKMPVSAGIEIDLSQYYKESLKLALYSCTHFGSRWQQPSNLRAFYTICEEQGVQAFVHHGDGVDGARMYAGQEQEQFAIGLDEQEDLWAELHPKSGLPQYVGGGNHDYSWVKSAGANVVRRVCARRDDLIYTGMQDAKFLIGDKLLYKFLHFRGGTSYALSYRLQRLNEALGREKDNPQIFGVGGQHVAALLPNYLGIASVMMGCFQGKTPYLQGKGLHPDIGGWVLEMHLKDDGGLARVRSEFISFAEVENDY